MKLLRRVQIYLIIPLSIALLVHLQVIPLEMVLGILKLQIRVLISK